MTHAVHLLDEVDEVILMKDGMVAVRGPFSDVKNHREYAIYSNNAKKNEEKTLEEEKQNSPKKKTEDNTETKKVSIQTNDLNVLKLEIKKLRTAKVKEKYSKETEENKNRKDGQLSKKENKEEGNVGFSVYMQYFSYYNTCLFIITVALYLIFIVGATWVQFWLVYWTTHDFFYFTQNQFSYGSLILVVCLFLTAVLKASFFTWGTGRASFNLNKDFINSLLRRPLSFFDTTPVG